jgi:hypothetical protein
MSDTQPFEIKPTSCDQAQETIFGLIEAEPVAMAEQAALTVHLAQCANCQAYQQTMGNLSLSILNLEEVPVPIALEERIVSRIAQEDRLLKTNTLSSTVHRFPWKKYGAMAASVLVLAVVIPLTLKNTQPEQSNPTVALRNGTTDEMILQPSNARRIQLQPKPVLDEVKPESKPQIQSGQEQRDQRVKLEIQPKPIAQNNTTVKVKPVETVDVEAGTQQLAFAGSMGNSLLHTYASETESDVYYDPVSTLVGF